jgi:hypothetical protein
MGYERNSQCKFTGVIDPSSGRIPRNVTVMKSALITMISFDEIPVS